MFADRYLLPQLYFLMEINCVHLPLDAYFLTAMICVALALISKKILVNLALSFIVLLRVILSVKLKKMEGKAELNFPSGLFALKSQFLACFPFG